MDVVKQVGQSFDGETPLAFENGMISNLAIPWSCRCKTFVSSRSVSLPRSVRISVASARARPSVRSSAASENITTIEEEFRVRRGATDLPECPRPASASSITRPVYHCIVVLSAGCKNINALLRLRPTPDVKKGRTKSVQTKLKS